MKLIFSVVILVSLAGAQQAPVDKSKRPSPPATAQCKFADGNTVTVDYSQPSMRGRKIYGGLVPYGQVWRTGANEATTFVPTVNVSVAGTTVPKGNYTLFTLPTETSWKLIVSRKIGEWGIPYPGEQHDLTRVEMKNEKLSAPVEKFTISFDQQGGDACTMRLDWEKTRESVVVRERQ